MDTPPPPSPAEHFARLIDGLCKAVAARGAKSANRIELPLLILPGPLVVLIWQYLRRIGLRIAAGLRARRRRPRQTLGGPLPSAEPRLKRKPPPPHPLMRGAGWLFRMVPEARYGGSHLRHMLSDPEIAALFADSPQLRRALRPVCRMLNVALPPLPVSASPDPPPAPAPAPAPALQPKRAARRVATYPPGLVPVPARWRLQPLPAPPPAAAPAGRRFRHNGGDLLNRSCSTLRAVRRRRRAPMLYWQRRTTQEDACRLT